MTGTAGFLLQFGIVLILGLISILTIWERVRKPLRVSFVVPFVFTVVFGLFLLIFLRQAVRIRDLRNLSSAEVSSINYCDVTFRDSEHINAITQALNQIQWYSTRRSDLLGEEILSIHFKNGKEWCLLVGANRYGPGTVMQLSVNGFSSGYAYSPMLGDVLQRR